MKKKLVILGLLGPALDDGEGPGRWSRWRPTVSMFQQEDLVVDRLELIHQARFDKLAKLVELDIAMVSPETKVARHTVEFSDAWDFEGVYAALLDFANGYPFDAEREDYLLHITTGTHVAQICLFLLAESRLIPARLAQTSPPSRKKGANREDPGQVRIIDLDLSRYDQIAQRFHRQQREGLSFLKAGIDTKNAAFNLVIEQLEHVAGASKEPILLTGPTGAGKSKLARRVFELKKRRRQLGGKFVEVNCATLRGDGAMSTLFGHKRGAFTGAVSDRPGLLREADEGLLFLDEVGELGLDEQAMLLRAIEDKTFLPLGSDKEVHSEFQLICGTNRDLGLGVGEGRFREDLMARINLWTFALPALVDRREDLEPNVRFELEQIAARTGVQTRFNREASERFMSFALSDQALWRGNFRDLSAAIMRMSTMATAGRITIDVVEAEIGRLRRAWGPAEASIAAQDDQELLEGVMGPRRTSELDLFDRIQLAGVIRVCRKCRTLSDAGRRLYEVSRTRRSVANDADRLRKYLARFELNWDELIKN